MGELLLATLSYHDVAGRRPEALYQALVAGLLVRLDPTPVVSTIREAGFGRVDVLVSPREVGGVGVVLELKVIDREDGETVEQALAAALRQLRERAYAAEVRARGAGVVRQMAAVLTGSGLGWRLLRRRRLWLRTPGAWSKPRTFGHLNPAKRNRTLAPVGASDALHRQQPPRSALDQPDPGHPTPHILLK